jgi:hypothetical protein
VCDICITVHDVVVHSRRSLATEYASEMAWTREEKKE